MDPHKIPDDSFPEFLNSSVHSLLDDSKLGNILSPNSGGGPSSPCPRGKTMREFEAELADLKQENFELKMKIYVLEEQKTVLEDERDVSELRVGYQQLQKELEKVKSELGEKEDLIFKAGEAMMLMSKKHEDDLTMIRNQAVMEVEKYKDAMARLEQEIVELKEKSMMSLKPGLFEDSSAMYAVAFNLPGSRPKTADPTSPDRISELEGKILELEDMLRTKSLEVNDLIAKSSTLKLEADQLRASESHLKSDLEFRVKKLSDALSKLSCAEKQIQDLKLRLSDSNISNQDIPTDFQHLQKQYTATKTENQKLQDQVLRLHQRITELEKYNAVDIHKRIDSLIKENVELQEKICDMKEEGFGKISKGSNHEKGSGVGDEVGRLAELEAELEKARQELSETKTEGMKMKKTIQAFVKQNRALSRDIELLRQEGASGVRTAGTCDQTSPDPQKEVADTTTKDLDGKDKSDLDGDDPEKVYLYSALEDKRKQVDQLNEKLRKRTIDLQELVNKELWSKNKEIEKLNRVCEKQVRDWSEQRTKLKGQESEIKSLNEEIERLRQMLGDAVSNRSSNETSNNIDSSLLKAELERVKSRLEAEVEANKELSLRCERLKLEAEGWEKSRKDLMNACCLLTTRLEEISTFLESLLPSLAGRKRRLVKEAIDMSREVSKSLSLSCLDDSALHQSITTFPILPDVSQVDFNSEDDPEDTLLPSSEALEDHKNEMLRIRTQMDSLVEKLKETTPEKKPSPKQVSPFSLSSTLQERIEFSPQDIGDSTFFGDGIPAICLEDITEVTGIESFETDTEIRNFPDELTPKKDSKRNSAICPGSESEGWSEPDRTVSLARIGLKEETPVPVRETGSESSDSPGKSNNSSVKKRRDNEIKILQMKIKSLELTIESLVSEKTKPSDLSICTNDHSVDCQVLGENTLTQNLMAGLIDQREKLMLSLNQNDFIRQRLGEALSSAPSSPTKSDNEKPKTFNSNLIQQVIKMTDKLEESCSLCSQLETRCKEVEKEKSSLIQLLSASEDKANALATELNGLRCILKEKENELLENECSLLEVKNNVIILESKVKLSQEELTKQTKLFEAHSQESSAKMNELKDKWEKERADLINCYENEICVAKMRVKELEVAIERAVAEREKARGERDLLEGEVKIRLDRMEREKREAWERRAELESRLQECLKAQAELQARLEKESALVADIEASAKEVRCELEKRVTDLEMVNQELETRLVTLTSSAPASPRGNFKRQRSNPTSDYTSDHEHHNIWFPVCGRSNNNSSPDLGIESDNRMSSLEQPLSSPKSNGENRRKLELENSELRAQLGRMRQALEETVEQLNSANQRKRQVEKAICRQIHKTHDILQKARLNLEPSEKHNI